MLGRVSDIDLRLLRAFVAVVESGGFSLATARLNISESTISSHMSDLESRLGMRLCERGRSGFRLTHDGEQVYRSVLELFDHMDRFRDHLAALNSQLGGTLRLGVADAIITNPGLPVVKWLGEFARRAPEISLEVRMLDPRGLERRLVEEEIHLAIGPQHREIAGLAYIPVGIETNLLYCGRGHPLFAEPDGAITKEKLEQGGLISRGYWERFDEAFFAAEGHRATVHHIEAAALLILTGQYIGFLPQHFATNAIARGDLRALKPEEIKLDVTFAVIHKRTRATDPRVTKFVKMVKEMAAA
jgi:DNA-binding transcriptional LysR family regulator